MDKDYNRTSICRMLDEAEEDFIIELDGSQYLSIEDLQGTMRFLGKLNTYHCTIIITINQVAYNVLHLAFKVNTQDSMFKNLTFKIGEM